MSLRSAVFPLSDQQEIVWLHQQIAPDSRAYHFTSVFAFHGVVRPELLRRSVLDAVGRHDAMRLRFRDGDGGIAVQQVVDDVHVDIPEHDLRGTTDVERRRAELLDEHMLGAFDLRVAPLARWALVRLADDHWQLFHAEHHLIHDGRSFSRFADDVLGQYYAAVSGTPFVADAAPSYTDYVAYTRSDEYRATMATDVEWWTARLDGATFGIEFPGLGHRSAATRDFAGAQHRQSIPPELMDAVGAAARGDGCTVFSAMFAIFAELCRRHSGHDDLVIGTALPNRPPAFDRTVGMMVNSVPVRLTVDPERTCRELARDVMGAVFDAADHQSAPIQHIVRALGSTGGLDNPLFDVMFSIHDHPLPKAAVDGLSVDVHGGLNPSTARFDLDVLVLPRDVVYAGDDHGYTLLWDYSTQRFDDADVRTLAARYEALLREYAHRSGEAVGALQMAPVAPPAPESRDELDVCDVSDVLAGVLPGAAGSVALIHGTEILTFAELDGRVRSRAAALSSAGIGRDDVLAVRLPRGVDVVVLLLACLRSGIVFAPVSMTTPPGRLAEVLGRLAPAAVAVRREDVKDFSSTDLVLRDAARPDVVLRAGVRGGRSESAAYVIHTSGTTGVPKAVAVPAGSLGATVAALRSTYGLTADDRVLQFADPAFDVFLEEVLPTLASGACVVSPRHEAPSGSELAALVLARDVSVVDLPTSYALAVAEELRAALAGRPHRLRLTVVWGDPLDAAALRRIAGIADGMRALNTYGVTEAVITSTYYDAADLGARPDTATVPIGQPLRGTDIRVVDAAGRPAAFGQVGQLAVAVAGEPARYLDDAEATARRYTRLPGHGDRTYYLTGDVGHQDAAGRFHFVGRQDRQVKVNGYRIELEEIEIAVRAVLPDADCVVTVTRSASGDADVLTCLLSGVSDALAAELPAALRSRLPRYAIPRRCHVVPAIPRDPGTGKVRLEALVVPAEPATTPGPGRHEVVDSLWLTAFRHVLERDDLDADTDFFQAGGHSLLVFRLLSHYESLCGWRPPTSLVFEFSTPSQLEAESAERRKPASAGRV